MKPKIIANNALSQNLAGLLGYFDHLGDTRYLRQAIKDKVDEIKNKYDISITINTVMGWIEAREDNPCRSLKWPSLELLIPFTENLGINYMELFIPHNQQKNEYIKLSGLISEKRRLVESILRIPDDDIESINGIRSYISGIVGDKVKEIEKKSEKKQEEYKAIISLLEVLN